MSFDRRSWRCLFGPLVVVIVLSSTEQLAVHAASSAGTSSNTAATLDTLLDRHGDRIQLLKSLVKKTSRELDVKKPPFDNDVFYLRYCVEESFKTEEDCIDAFTDMLQWRKSKQGRRVCSAARDAVHEAADKHHRHHHRRKGGNDATTPPPWNNEAVAQHVPHGEVINQFMTCDQALTTTSSNGDLLYIIRSSMLDDPALMRALGNDSVQKMTDFLLFAKEVNHLVANQRSLEQNRLVLVITVNDLHKASGPSKPFKKALGESSKLGKVYWKGTFGELLMLNLPRWLGGIANLFAPVGAKLKFAHGPLRNVPRLMDVSYGGSKRVEFLKQIDKLVYDGDNKRKR